MEKLKKRKTTRLASGDYNHTGAFFLTICTKNRKCMLSHIVGTGVLDGPPLEKPSIELTAHGKIADKYIRQLNEFYDHISIEQYVIMPNHIHLLLLVSPKERLNTLENGPSGTPVPTLQNSVVSQFVSTFKRFCNKEYGENIWQTRSYDHIIRNQKDYEEHVNYIMQNPIRWCFDELYSDECVNKQ